MTLKLLKKLPAPIYAGAIGGGIGLTIGIVTGIVGFGDGVNGATVFGPIGLIFGVLFVYAYRGIKKK
jgi:uncharacterized RDD family membrane protein YckC